MKSKTLHRHHIIPKHMGGTNDEWNLTEPITVEDHAKAHKELFELYGKPQDYIAWKCLEGSLSNQEARILASKIAISKEIIVNNIKYESIADAQKALGLSYKRIVKAVLENRDPTIRADATPITVNGIQYKSLREAEKATGISRSKLKSNTDLNKDMRKEKLKCPHCNKEGDKLNMERWHMNNCKHKTEGKVL